MIDETTGRVVAKENITAMTEYLIRATLQMNGEKKVERV